MWKEDITFEESLRNILPAIARKVEERMPETGTFKRFGYRFDVDASYFDEGACGLIMTARSCRRGGS